MWIILAILACVALAVFWRGPNATWGGIASGALVGLALALISIFRDAGFPWLTIAKGIVVGVLLGAVADILGKWSDRKRAPR
jgi:uncharacterized YccA/Bax inhibitor family protein